MSTISGWRMGYEGMRSAMKRTPLQRKTPLKQKTYIKRGVPINWNPSETKKRKKRAQERGKLYAELSVPLTVRQTDDDYLDWIRGRACVVCGCRGGQGMDRIDPAHTETVRSGGSDRRAMPLCRRHHTEQHQIGVQTFAETYGLMYEIIIDDLNARYEAQQRP